jgi:hypothetical protein
MESGTEGRREDRGWEGLRDGGQREEVRQGDREGDREGGRGSKRIARAYRHRRKNAL